MKRVMFLVAIGLLLLWLMAGRSDFYLIAGSDAIDVVYKAPLWVFVGVAMAAVGSWLVVLFSRLKWMAVPASVLLLMLLLPSQAVVDSGKRQQVEYYLAGVQLAAISYDPTADGSLTVLSVNPLVSEIAIQGQSMRVVSGLCPLCIDLTGMATP